VVPLLTALVVDPDLDSRASVAGLLELTGWQAREATGPDDALLAAAELDPDLVVTDADLDGDSGATLLRRLRACGSRAQFLVVTAAPTPQLRADSARAGALACLAKPVDERLLLDFLRSRATGTAAEENIAREIRELDDLDDADLGAELMDRLHEMYAIALPGRLSAIAQGARSGDAPALASAAQTLAGTSGQLGHPEVASVCQAIAQDARRGILAHARVVQLRALLGA
jgi:CheY-like chemotaxis protein